jgi:hypothetical protein
VIPLAQAHAGGPAGVSKRESATRNMIAPVASASAATGDATRRA